MGPDFDSIPLDAYGDMPPMDDDEESFYFDLPVIEKDVPAPPPRAAKRKPFTSGRVEDVQPFLDLPEALYDTVIGRLAVVVSDKLEFPIVSVFMALLASASPAVSCAYATRYKTKKPVPLGLYVVIEQPSATQKSYLLDIGIEAYEMAMGQHNKKISAKHREHKERDMDKDESLRFGFSNTTDATSASLDRGLVHCSEGRFVIATAEQSGLNSLFPDAGTFSSNNELVLKGYVGEYVSGMRGGREAFSGVVQGSIILIAQQGSAKRVLSASNGTGLAERFIFIAEPTMLGGRELLGIYPSLNDIAPFQNACTKCVEIYSERIFQIAGRSEPEVLDPKNLFPVFPTDNGFHMILEKRRIIEHKIGLLNEKGDNFGSSWLGKYETQVIKLAGVLHVIECLGTGVRVDQHIPDNFIGACMEFVDLIGDHIPDVLKASGESGVDAEEDCFVDALSQRALSRREVLVKVKSRKPYRSMRDGYAVAGKRLEAMIADGVIIVNSNGKLEVV